MGGRLIFTYSEFYTSGLRVTAGPVLLRLTDLTGKAMNFFPSKFCWDVQLCANAMFFGLIISFCS